MPERPISELVAVCDAIPAPIREAWAEERRARELEQLRSCQFIAGDTTQVTADRARQRWCIAHAKLRRVLERHSRVP